MPPPPSNVIIHEASEYITLPTVLGANIVVHAPSEVVYVKGAQDYTEVVLVCGARYLVSGRLEKWSQRLTGYGFLRVHRSQTVNLAMVRSWEECKRHLVLKMHGGDKITVSANYKREFFRCVK